MVVALVTVARKGWEELSVATAAEGECVAGEVQAAVATAATVVVTLMSRCFAGGESDGCRCATPPVLCCRFCYQFECKC